MTNDNFLSEYLKRGLSEIVIIDHKHHEKQSGSYHEEISETVVARKGIGFARASASCHYNRYKPSWGPRITSEEAISAEQYSQLAAGKTIIDTAEALAQIAHQKEVNRHRQNLKDKLPSLTPKCPKCGQGMQMRLGPNGSFWGCPGYPLCKRTKRLSDEVQAIQKELGGLK